MVPRGKITFPTMKACTLLLIKYSWMIRYVVQKTKEKKYTNNNSQ